MNNPSTHVEGTVAPSDIENVEHLLGDLEIGADGGASEVIENLGELDASAEDAVKGAIAKAEAYEEQPVAATGVAAPAKVRKARTPREPKIRATRDIGALPVETFALVIGNLADERNKTAVLALRPTQKKIGDKFDNLFLSIAAGKKASVYTMACFATLIEKGEVTQSDLVTSLKATLSVSGKHKGTGYHDGTARSQAGQIMALFAVTGIATRVKQTLTLNADSALVPKMKALVA